MCYHFLKEFVQIEPSGAVQHWDSLHGDIRFLFLGHLWPYAYFLKFAFLWKAVLF